MNHTPTPWKLETVEINNKTGTCHKIGPFPSSGAYAETYACVYANTIRLHDYGHSTIGDELLANAQFIVRACNAHEELVAALHRILDGNTMAGRENWTHADVIQEHYKIARKAIAKAEGRETL